VIQSVKMSPVAFIGLGKMGAPMAANLAKAGHEVRGFDLARDACAAVERQGVAVAASAREAAAGAAAVITMLPAGAHVLAALDDVLPTLRAGSLVIDCSTIDVASARRIHERVAATGANCVDAPVSGGVAGARAGALTFLCGGSEAAFEAARPFLEAMGKNIVRSGGPGLGQAAKLCNNMILGATMIVTAEAFVLGERLGLSHQALFDAVSISSGQSWSLTSYCPVPGPVPASPANSGYQPGFMAALMLKDLKLSQDAASEAGVATPLGATARQLFALFNALGHGAEDFSAIINLIRGENASDG
jgi:3-hydroxyisobutyrate dehydrogenase